MTADSEPTISLELVKFNNTWRENKGLNTRNIEEVKKYKSSPISKLTGTGSSRIYYVGEDDKVYCYEQENPCNYYGSGKRAYDNNFGDINIDSTMKKTHACSVFFISKSIESYI